MVWRNSVTSPDGFRYFLVVFKSLGEIFSQNIPEWFDNNTMGIIYLHKNYYDATDPALYISGVDGPSDYNDGDWVNNLGYAQFPVPTFDHNLAVYYPYRGTVTHLAFVRNYLLDKSKDGQIMYAWTIGTSQWATVYTNTLECTTSTTLYTYDGTTWSTSTATIDSDVWTDNASVVIENDAASVASGSIVVTATTGTYSNAEQTFCGLVAPAGSEISIAVSGTGWQWSDTGEATTPRVMNVGTYGTYLLVNSN